MQPADVERLLARHPAVRTHLVHLAGGVPQQLVAGKQVPLLYDWDVEVAQASFIADPVINVLQDGSVLDVKVAGGSGERAWGAVRSATAAALRKLTGVDHGTSAAKWKAWRTAHPAGAVSSASGGE